jgi:hypothetical protein
MSEHEASAGAHDVSADPFGVANRSRFLEVLSARL